MRNFLSHSMTFFFGVGFGAGAVVMLAAYEFVVAYREAQE